MSFRLSGRNYFPPWPSERPKRTKGPVGAGCWVLHTGGRVGQAQASDDAMPCDVMRCEARRGEARRGEPRHTDTLFHSVAQSLTKHPTYTAVRCLHRPPRLPTCSRWPRDPWRAGWRATLQGKLVGDETRPAVRDHHHHRTEQSRAEQNKAEYKVHLSAWLAGSRSTTANHDQQQRRTCTTICTTIGVCSGTQHSLQHKHMGRATSGQGRTSAAPRSEANTTQGHVPLHLPSTIM
jgi:hypothetical protein